ncbi:hypothetical protein A3A50_00480 [Candidatus Woesebacteria bacterium RIFCSPLOWO2_01_FULL_38_20]|nr:MAG: hypothetical protein A3A50_00480 [Candidatus Woesebacteria bacterium RIFCSPLOWO2_01_FULL_38_20]
MSEQNGVVNDLNLVQKRALFVGEKVEHRTSEMQKVRVELEDKSSAWGKAFESIKKRHLYQDKSDVFVAGFAVPWIAKLRENLREEATKHKDPKGNLAKRSEEEIARVITDYLSYASQKEIEDLKQNRSLNNIMVEAISVRLGEEAGTQKFVKAGSERLEKKKTSRTKLAVAGAVSLVSAGLMFLARDKAPAIPAVAAAPEPTGIPTATVPAAETLLPPTTTPTPEPTLTPSASATPEQYPVPEDQVNPGFMIGAVSLEKPIEMLIPEELAKMAGYEGEQKFKISEPILQLSEIEYTGVDTFNNWRDHPESALIFRANPAEQKKSNVLLGHSVTGSNGQDLPLEWVRKLMGKVDPNKLRGQTLFIKQEINGKTIIQKVKIVDARESTAEQVLSSYVNNDKDNEPIYANLGKGGYGLPDSVRQDNTLILVACAGKLDASGFYGYLDRALLTVKAVDSSVRVGQ